ncbi:MAG TPA: hypothetical protein VJ180_14255, partial [Pyrinomonadaceae bacterium]|nr:hypothetical protein [Pyrinomonadaceae bacterium]
SGIFTLSLGADGLHGNTDLVSHSDLQPVPAQTPQGEQKTAEEQGDEVIRIVKKIPPKEEKKQPAAGPPSKQAMLEDELRIRAMFLEAQLKQAKEARERAEKATNPAERQVLLKDAAVKSETAASMTRSITGQPSQPAQTSQASQPAASQQRGESRIKVNSGILEELQRVETQYSDAVKSKSVDGAVQRANEAYKEGRAGAGGVALYKAATMTTPLDLSKIEGAAVEGGRLVLMYEGKTLRFPELDPQFLALAIRSVYGGEGLVKGKLLADEKNAVVLSTGKDQYGDVVWKKEFLPGLPQNLKPGEEIALDLGPGVGVLSLPDPSMDRVTYYGPLKGNILGQVVQEADMVFSMFWYGVDWRTGRPLDPNKLPGYQSSIENALKEPEKPASPAPQQPREKAKNWWEETVWFVWTPDEMSLQLVAETSEFAFVKSSMKCNVWGVREDHVRPSSRVEGQYLTQHYDEFARAFPVLNSLKEAAKAVSVVRWMKQNGVALDLAWAKSFPLTKIETPDTIRRFTVLIHRDSSGRPQVETQP